MRAGIIISGIIIVAITIIIYIIKNNKSVFKIIEKILNTRIKYVCIILLLGVCALIIYENGNSIIKDLKIFKINKEYEEMYKYSEEKKSKENAYYQKMCIKDYNEDAYKNPYLPDGFEFVEGKYEDGYVIQDKDKNQYVWIPCTNKEIDGISKLEKRNFVIPVFISKDVCYDEGYDKFVKSAFEYGGFYISRFEIGKENDKPVSKANVELLTNISKNEAKEIISKMYENTNINCELINGFAYDTTLDWIKKTNQIKPNKIDIKESIYTGRNQYNNIYDFCDNILEFSTEIFYENIIIRGFSGSSEEMNLGVSFSDESRYSIFEDDTSVSLIDGIAVRTILYK